MFSYVDGWAEQGSDLDDRQQGSLDCAKSPACTAVTSVGRGSGNCGNCGNPLQKPVERASGVPSSGGAC
jgi:hypothetical protein